MEPDPCHPIPRSRREAVLGGLPHYQTGKPCKYGHIDLRSTHDGRCVQCRKEYARAYFHGEKYQAYRREYLQTEKVKEASRLRGRKRLSTPEGRAKSAASTKKSMQRPEAKIWQRESYKRYLQTPKGRAATRSAQSNRRAIKQNALPKWQDRTEVDSFIRNCPPGFHVDHIITLRGRNICGLHVIGNLQYLPAHENVTKSNKVDPLTLEANVCVLPQYRSYVRG
jgi:hypothetical protein